MKKLLLTLSLTLAGSFAVNADTLQVLVVNSGTTNIAHFGINAGIGVGFPPYVCGSSGSIAFTLGDVPASSSKLFTVNIGGGWTYPLAGGFGPSGGATGVWPVGVTNLGPCTFTVPNNGAYLQFQVQAGGPATNCPLTFTITNAAAYPAIYAITYNDALTGMYVYVEPGAAVSVTVTSPTCDATRWAYFQVMNGTLNGGNYAPTQGGQIITGAQGNGIWGGDLNNKPLNLNLGPPNTTPPPPIIGNNDGGPAAFNPFPPQTTNGPVAFPTNTAPGSNANNGTIMAGDNALYNATVNGNNSLLQAINQVDSDLKLNTASTSNMLGRLTNSGGGSNADYSGVLGQIATNTGNTAANTAALTNYSDITNLLASAFLAQLTNMEAAGRAAGSAITNAFGTALGGFPTAPGLGGGGDGVRIATAGGAPDVVIGVSVLPASFDAPRGVIAWVIWLLTYIAMIRFAQEKVLRIFNQRQVQGSEEEIMGVNASLLTAFAYGAVIAATVAAVPTAIASYLQSASSSVSSFNSLSTLSANPLWNLMTQLVPVSVVLTAFFSYVTFRYLIAFPLIIVSTTIIMFLVV